MKRITLSIALFAISLYMANAQTFKFDFTSSKKAQAGFVKVTSNTLFSNDAGFGYDFDTAWDGKGNKPFFFSVVVPDGNYRVTVTLGSKQSDGSTTVRAESRRLFLENIGTRKGELRTETFIVNKRDTLIKKGRYVKIKTRERLKMNWDNKLTLEFNGDKPRVSSVTIERDDNVPTVFLCGNSTVVDNDAEPFTSWGQMIPRFFNDKVAIANYAESGLSANTFIGGLRLEKILTQMKKGDWLFFEFGHNDQKQKGPGKGAYYSFAYYLKQFIDEAKSKGANPVLVTPTRRRHFDENGKVKNTHEDYPAAIREIGARENVPVIDLQDMTKTLIEAMGEEDSKKLFVHYPANTYMYQPKPLADNSHFSTFGAYEVAKCIVEGIKANHLSLEGFIREDVKPFNPAQPDEFKTFKWNLSPFTATRKPDGN